ncbi:hypothetical protein D3C76_1005650 [compost metagenome]
MTDVDSDDRLDRHVGQQHHHGRHQQCPYDRPARTGPLDRELFLASGPVRTTIEILANQHDGGDGRHCDHRATHKKSAADTHQLRQKSPYQWPDQVAGQRPRRQHPQRPTGFFPRHLGADHDERSRGITADEPGDQAQHHQISNVPRQPDQRHHDRHANGRAHQHRFTSETIGQPAPEWRSNRRAKECRAERYGRALHHIGLPGDTQLLHIQRQERQQHAQAHQGGE